MITLRRLVSHPTTYLVLAAVLLLAHALFYARLMDFDAVDDAYISFRYAYNAARGYGLTFNVGERRVEGYTNFLWTVMLIPCFWLRLPVHTASLILGTLWSLGCILLLGLFSGSLAHHGSTIHRSGELDRHGLEGPGRWLGAIAALLLATDGSFALWAVGGLEAPLFAFLVLAGGLAYLREVRDPKVVPLSGAWFALAAMARPEGLLVFGVTVIHGLIVRLVERRRQRFIFFISRQDWLRLALFALIWTPWFAFRWRYYGFPLPNTFYAKVTLGDTSAQRLRGWNYVQTFVRIHLGIAPLAAALLPLLRRRWRVWSSYFVSVIVVYSLYIAYVGGDWSVGRFFVPLLPLFYALLAGGLIVGGERIKGWVDSKRRCESPEKAAKQSPTGIITIIVAAALIVGLMIGLFVQSSLNGEKKLFLDPFDARLAGRARTQMGKWLHDNVPRDTYIAVDAAGQMPFYADLRALDLYGLNDLTIAHSQIKSMGEGTPGHEKMNMDYVIFAAQPDYIIIYGTAFDWLAAFSYERVDLPWTDDPTLKTFLGVYQRQ